MCQSGETLKYLNTFVGILVKSDDTEGGLAPADATISALHPHCLVLSKSALIVVIMSWHAV